MSCCVSCQGAEEDEEQAAERAGKAAYDRVLAKVRFTDLNLRFLGSQLASVGAACCRRAEHLNT